MRIPDAARRAGVDLGALRSTISKNEVATLQTADAQGDLVKQLSKMTYNGKGAMKSLRSLGFAATATSRSLSEMAPIAASLQDMGIKGDVGDELNRVAEIAKTLRLDHEQVSRSYLKRLRRWQEDLER